MNLSGISRFCVLTSLAVLLLAGCGHDQGIAGVGSSPPSPAITTSPPSAGITASPQAEGTGPEPPASPQGGGNGGVAISMPGLPIGNNSESGLPDGECVEVIWKGQPPFGANVVTVTSVAVTSGPFRPVQDATDCQDGPACVSYRITATNIGRASCYAEVQYTGPPVTDPYAPAIDGTLTLTGELSCPDGGVAACRQDGLGMQGSGATSISFQADLAPAGSPGVDSPSASPDSSAPTATGSP
jgi:hypothetical protein